MTFIFRVYNNYIINTPKRNNNTKNREIIIFILFVLNYINFK